MATRWVKQPAFIKSILVFCGVGGRIMRALRSMLFLGRAVAPVEERLLSCGARSSDTQGKLTILSSVSKARRLKERPSPACLHANFL